MFKRDPTIIAKKIQLGQIQQLSPLQIKTSIVLPSGIPWEQPIPEIPPFSITANLSLVDGAAFITNPSINLTKYVDYYILLTDTSGKEAGGWIKAAGTGETYGSELLVDGGLEIWNDASNLANWAHSGGVTGSWNRESTIVHGGIYSARLDVGAADDFIAFIQIPIATQGWLIKWTAWMYASESGKTLGILYAGNESPRNPGATWTQYLYYGTNTITNSVLYLKRESAASSSLYFDDISLKQILTPSTTGVTIVSEKGGTTYNWNKKGSTFDPNSATFIVHVLRTYP